MTSTLRCHAFLVRIIERHVSAAINQPNLARLIHATNRRTVRSKIIAHLKNGSAIPHALNGSTAADTHNHRALTVHAPHGPATTNNVNAPTLIHALHAATRNNEFNRRFIMHLFNETAVVNAVNMRVLAQHTSASTNVTHTRITQHVIHASMRINHANARRAAHPIHARRASQLTNARLVHHTENTRITRHHVNHRTVTHAIHLRQGSKRTRIARLAMVSQQPNMRVITHVTDTHTKRPLNGRVTADHRHVHTITVIDVAANVHEIVNAASVNTHIRFRVTNNRPTELLVREHHRLTLVADSLHHVLHQHAITIPTTRSVNRKARTILALSERRRFRFPVETSRLARNQLLGRSLSLTLRPKMRRIRTKRTLPRPSAALPRLTLTIHMPLHSHQKTSTPP